MKRITILNNSGRQTVIVPENKTVRQILEENNVNYSVGVTGINGITLADAQLDGGIGDFVDGDSAFLTVVVKAQNAADVSVLGNAAIVESDILLDDLKLIKKYRPDALVLKDEDGAPYFMVGIADDPAGEADKFGFIASPTATNEGYAQVTLMVDIDDNIIDRLEDELGACLINLDEIEKAVPGLIDEIKAEREAVRSRIVLL